MITVNGSHPNHPQIISFNQLNSGASEFRLFFLNLYQISHQKFFFFFFFFAINNYLNKTVDKTLSTLYDSLRKINLLLYKIDDFYKFLCKRTFHKTFKSFCSNKKKKFKSFFFSSSEFEASFFFPVYSKKINK